MRLFPGRFPAYSLIYVTIFIGIASATLFGHTLTVNFILGISIVFISTHQFFSPLAKVEDETPYAKLEMAVPQNTRLKEISFIDMTAGATEDASNRVGADEKEPLLRIRSPV